MLAAPIGAVVLLIVVMATAANAAQLTLGFSANHLMQQRNPDGSGNYPVLYDSGSGPGSGYLARLHAKSVRIGTRWCAVEPTKNSYGPAALDSLRDNVATAVYFGYKPLVMVPPSAPVYTRRAPMRVGATTGCNAPSGFPPNEGGTHAAPANTDESVDQYAKAVNQIAVCLAGSTGCAAGPGTYPNLLPYLQGIELGNEPNFSHYWQTGYCTADGTTWYETNDCNGHGEIGRINRSDARLYGEMASNAASVVGVNWDIKFSTAGVSYPEDSGWGSTHPGGFDYITEMETAAPKVPTWDALAIHPYSQHYSSFYSAWSDVKDDIDQLRSYMSGRESYQTQVWITEVGSGSGEYTFTAPGGTQYTNHSGCTNALACSESGQAVVLNDIWGGIRDHYCALTANPVRYVSFYRLEDDPDSTFGPNLGVMKPSDNGTYRLPYFGKTAYSSLANYTADPTCS